MDLLNLKFIFISIIVIIVAYITLYIYQFYSQLKRYPNGPKPLPFIGNLHLFIGNTNRHPIYLFKELSQHYGELYTFWLGSKPVVLLNDIETSKQAFNQNECSDRFEPHIGSKLRELIFNNSNSILIMNYSVEQKVLRNISIEALRKFMANNVLSEITRKIVDNTVDIMRAKELDKPFVPFKYVDSIFIRVLFESIFNKPLAFDNHKVTAILQHFDCLQMNLLKVIVAENNPVLKMFLYTSDMKTSGQRFIELIKKRFSKYNKLDIGSDNCHSLLESHILAANNNNSINKYGTNNNEDQYLSDSNIIGNLANLFAAGSDTTHYTFKWILLLMSYYPEMQQRMREEIRNKIGNKIPDKTDKELCHYVNAFICETLRFRFIVLAAFHLTSNDTHIANKFIPKGTIIIMNQISILNDKNYWQNPETFIPDRFLDEEQHFIAGKLPAFIPFGSGKRMCIGDKFAMNMLFLVLTRLLQATDGMTFELQDKLNTDLEPKRFGFFIEPKAYKLLLVKQKSN